MITLARKENLINWISKIKDDNLMKRLESIQNDSDEWTIEISDIEKKMLQLAEKDIENGHFIPHAQVMEEVSEYLARKK